MDIFLRVEVAAREFESKVLVGLVAASHGHRVYVSDWSTMMKSLIFRRGRAGFVHMNSVSPAKSTEAFHRIFRWAGFNISSLDEEAGTLWGSYEQFADARYGDSTLEHVDAIFCWGDHDRDSLREKFPSHARKFIRTGSPRADLWDPRFSSVYSAPITSLPKPYILIPSGVGGPLKWLHLHELLENLASTGYLERSPGFGKTVLDFYEDGVKLMRAYVDLIRHLSREFEQYEIVLKPHPSENPHAWRVVLGSIERVRVESECPVSPLIRQSSAVVTTGSTTAIEAGLAGVPVVSFLPFEMPTRDNTLVEEFGVRAETPDEVSIALRKLLETGNNLMPPSERVSVDFCNKIYLSNHELAAERMVDVWESLIHEETRAGSTRPRKWLSSRDFTYWFASAFPSITQLVLPGSRNRFEHRLGRNRKFPPINRESVRFLVGKLSDVIGLSGKISVKFIGSRGVLLLPKSSET